MKKLIINSWPIIPNQLYINNSNNNNPESFLLSKKKQHLFFLPGPVEQRLTSPLV